MFSSVLRDATKSSMILSKFGGSRNGDSFFLETLMGDLTLEEFPRAQHEDLIFQEHELP